MFLQENLNYLLELHGVNTNSISEVKGLKQSTIFRLAKGETSNPHQKTLNKISAWAGISVGDLLSVDLRARDKESKQNNAPSVSSVAQEEFKKGKLPVLSWSQAKEWTGEESLKAIKEQDWFPVLSCDCKDCYYLVAVGISNYPDYQAGDILLVYPERDIAKIDTDDMVIVTIGQETELRKLIIESNEKRYLQASNSNWTPNLVPYDSTCQVIGVLKDAFRPLFKNKNKTKGQIN